MPSKLDFNLSENTKYGVCLIIVIVACIGLFFMVIQPLRNDRAKMAAQILQANTKLAQLQTFAVQNQDYDSFLTIQKLKVEQAKKKLPDKVALPELIGEFSKLADVNGVVLISITPMESIKVGTAFGLPVNITLTGDYFRIVNFLQQLENGERFVTVQSTKFSTSNNGSLEMSANFVVYSVQKIGLNKGKNDTKKKNLISTFSEVKKTVSERAGQVKQIIGGEVSVDK